MIMKIKYLLIICITFSLNSHCFSDDKEYDIKFVREKEPGSGNFIDVTENGLPIFVPTDGKGRGSPKYIPAELTIKVNGTLSDKEKDIIKIEYVNPKEKFADTLVEIGNNSGLFKNKDESFQLKLDPAIETSNKKKETLHVIIESSAVKLKQSHFNLMETEASSSEFLSVPVDLSVKIFKDYDGTKIEKVMISAGGSDDYIWIAELNPIDEKPGYFINKVETIKLYIKDITKLFDKIEDNIEVELETHILPINNISLLLKEEFWHEIVLSTKQTYFYQSTDIVPENPSTSGHGIFYVKVEGDFGNIEELDVVISTDIETEIVKAYKLEKSVYRTGKLVLMHYEGNDDYENIVEIKTKGNSKITVSVDPPKNLQIKHK